MAERLKEAVIDERISTAIALSQEGAPIVPLNGKIPTIPNWQHVRADEQTEDEVFDLAERGNVGMPTGTASGRVIVDIDDEDHEGVKRDLGLDGVVTQEVLTGGGGLQLHFEIPTDVELKNTTKKLHPTVDTRGEGGQAVLPGSIHPDTGRPYEWVAGRGPGDVPLSPLPDSLLRRWLEAQRSTTDVVSTSDLEAVAIIDGLDENVRHRLLCYAESACDRIALDLSEAKEGTRNATLFRVACRLFEFANAGLLEHDVVEARLRKAAARTRLDDDEVGRALASAASRVSGKGPDVRRLLAKWDVAVPESSGEDEDDQLAEFPVEVLPAVLRDLVVSVERSVQIEADLPALVGLVTVSAAMSRRVRIKVGRSHVEHPALWAVVAQEPGERKSAAMQHMVEPLSKREAELLVPYRLRRRQWEQEDNLISREIDALKRRIVKEDANREAYLAAIKKKEAERLPPPPSPAIMVDDCTPEALIQRLADQGGRAFLASAEGGIFARLADRKQKVQNLDPFLKGHAGEPIKVDRVGRGQEVVDEAVLNLAVCTQPSVLRELMADARFQGTGFLARMMLVRPRTRVGTRPYENIGIDRAAQARYEALISTLYDGKDESFVLRVEGDALDEWTAFYTRVEAAMRPGGALHGVREWASKLAGLCARIAAVLRVADDGGLREHRISRAAIQRAAAICDYLIEHALHLHAVEQDDRSGEVDEHVSRFRKDCTEPGDEVTLDELHDAYATWCASNEREPWERNRFGRALTSLGVGKRESNGKTLRTGIKLKERNP